MVQTWLSRLDLIVGCFNFSTHWADGGFGSALGIKVVETILMHPEFIGRTIWLMHSEDRFGMGNIGEKELGPYILQ